MPYSMTWVKIAELMNLTVAAVHMRLSRARQRLAERLEGDPGFESRLPPSRQGFLRGPSPWTMWIAFSISFYGSQMPERFPPAPMPERVRVAVARKLGQIRGERWIARAGPWPPAFRSSSGPCGRSARRIRQRLIVGRIFPLRVRDRRSWKDLTPPVMPMPGLKLAVFRLTNIRDFRDFRDAHIRVSRKSRMFVCSRMMLQPIHIYPDLYRRSSSSRAPPPNSRADIPPQFGYAAPELPDLRSGVSDAHNLARFMLAR